MARAVLVLLALALVACDAPEDPHHSESESCNRIFGACHPVDTSEGFISECHETAHDVGTDEACEPIEADER